MICELTVILKVAVDAHVPAVGVNVYTVVPIVEVLMVDGLQVPVIPFVEVSESAGAVLLWQSGPIAEKTGTVIALMVTLKVVLVAH